MRFLALPAERFRPYVTKRPSNRQTVRIRAAQNDPVALPPALCGDDIVELRVDEDNAPLFELRVEKPNRCSDRALLLISGRIADSEVLHGVAIHDPAKVQLTLLAEHGAVVAVERELRIPGAHQTVEGLRLFAKRRIRSRRPENIDHCGSK